MSPGHGDRATVRTEVADGVAWLTLDRPEALNSINPSLLRDFSKALDTLEMRGDVRCVVVTGEGRAFCAGGDLKALQAFEAELYPEVATNRFHRSVAGLMRELERFSCPVIAAVNGLAFAGGLEIVLCCDLVVASEDATFGDAHARYGLVPGGGGSVRLPRKIGPNRAKHMMFTAQAVPAQTMLDWGLLSAVVPAAQLREAAGALATIIASRSPIGLSRMKRLIDDGLDQPLETAIAHELAICMLHNGSADRAEGLAAFAERRLPSFVGR